MYTLQILPNKTVVNTNAHQKTAAILVTKIIPVLNIWGMGSSTFCGRFLERMHVVAIYLIQINLQLFSLDLKSRNGIVKNETL